MTVPQHIDKAKTLAAELRAMVVAFGDSSPCAEKTTLLEAADALDDMVMDYHDRRWAGDY